MDHGGDIYRLVCLAHVVKTETGGEGEGGIGKRGGGGGGGVIAKRGGMRKEGGGRAICCNNYVAHTEWSFVQYNYSDCTFSKANC